MQLDPPAAGFGKLRRVGGAPAPFALRHEGGGPAVASPARRLFVPRPGAGNAAEEVVDLQPLVGLDRGCEEACQAALEPETPGFRLVRRHGETGIQVVDDDRVGAGVEERRHPVGRSGAAQRLAVRDRLVVDPWQFDGELAAVQGEVRRPEHRPGRPGGDETELDARMSGNEDRFARIPTRAALPAYRVAKPEQAGRRFAVADEQAGLVLRRTLVVVGQPFEFGRRDDETRQIGLVQEVAHQTGQIHARLLGGAVEIGRGERRPPMVAEKVGHHGGGSLPAGAVENGGGQGGGLEVESVHGALRIFLYVEVGEGACEHRVPDAGAVRDAPDDAAGHRAAAAPELAREPGLHHAPDRPAELPVEQVGREVRLAAVDQPVHEVVAQGLQRQGLGAAGAGLVEEEVANAADLHVAACEVGAEELLQPVGLCSRQSALLVLVAFRVAEPELEARGRQTALAEQQHAGRRPLGVHAPAAAVGA